MPPAPTQLPITIFGRPTCEDTAIVRDRLQRYGVPFTEVDVDRDAGAGRLCESLNDGNRVTPTILFGGAEAALSEPSLDVLDARLIDEGWPIRRPEPTQVAADAGAQPVPLMTLVGADGAPFRLPRYQGHRHLAVFFAHAADCLACSGYARQVGAVVAKLADAGARALVVVPGDPSDAARWRAESTDKLPIVADQGGRWRAAVAARLGFDVGTPGARVIALDTLRAPRFVSAAPDAGGLITPMLAAEWLEFAALASGRDLRS